jgi:hypothetical protein
MVPLLPKHVSPLEYHSSLLSSLGLALSPSPSNTFASSVHAVFYLRQSKILLQLTGDCIVFEVCWLSAHLWLEKATHWNYLEGSFPLLFPSLCLHRPGGKAPDCGPLCESSEDAFLLPQLPPLSQKVAIWNQVLLSLTISFSQPLPHPPQLFPAWDRH